MFKDSSVTSKICTLKKLIVDRYIIDMYILDFKMKQQMETLQVSDS